jgi:N-succinyldiaminopimelate aminotransferase
MREPFLTSRLQGIGTTIFATMSALATEHDAVNLGQGFPDSDGPAAVLDAAVGAIRDGHNQYAPGMACPPCARRSSNTSAAGTASTSIPTPR